MNKTTIKNHADLKGYATDVETDTLISFSKGNKIITVDSSEMRITTIVGDTSGYNWVDDDTIEIVAKHLLR